MSKADKKKVKFMNALFAAVVFCALVAAFAKGFATPPGHSWDPPLIDNYGFPPEVRSANWVPYRAHPFGNKYSF